MKEKNWISLLCLLMDGTSEGFKSGYSITNAMLTFPKQIIFIQLPSNPFFFFFYCSFCLHKAGLILRVSPAVLKICHLCHHTVLCYQNILNGEVVLVIHRFHAWVPLEFLVCVLSGPGELLVWFGGLFWIGCCSHCNFKHILGVLCKEKFLYGDFGKCSNAEARTFQNSMRHFTGGRRDFILELVAFHSFRSL